MNMRLFYDYDLTMCKKEGEKKKEYIVSKILEKIFYFNT